MKQTITFSDLKELIESTSGKELPTAKELRNSNCEVIIRQEFLDHATLSVYKNGFALYESDLGDTVFRVDKCGGYTYFGCSPNITDDCLDEGYFDRKQWSLRLVLEAEDRLFHNQEVKAAANREPYGAPLEFLQEKKGANQLNQQAIQFYDQIETRELVEKMLASLEEKHRRIVIRYFIEGYTMKEIASEIGVSTPAVFDLLSTAKKRMKNFFENFYKHP